jgi:hypothetical protein
MKQIFLLSLLFFFSCSQPAQKTEPAKQETPKALQVNSSSEIDLSSIRKSYKQDDLVEELFNELADKKPEYKEIINAMHQLQETQPDSLEKFNNYHAKSLKYYTAAAFNTDEIQDSTLRLKLSLLLKKSQTNYENRISPTLKRIEQVNANSVAISDLIHVLKVTSTIRLIEDYQRKFADDKAIKILIKQQEALIGRLTEENKKNGF